MKFSSNRTRVCGSPVVKVPDHGRHVVNSAIIDPPWDSDALNLSRAETFSRWRGVVVRKKGANSGVIPRH
ncbi:hypothetical protein TNCV_3705471 [Trichonephila clavipes]|nr:hypothetical protein TNCV_3705471 [Trichonephila clavipes]